MSASKEELIQCAKLAEQTQRYDDMCQSMKKVVELGYALTAEELDLLVLAYEKAVSLRQSAWRILRSAEHEADGSANVQRVTSEYREKVEAELRSICDEFLIVLDKEYSKPHGTMSVVFCVKTTADFHRYLAEIASGPDRDALTKKCLEAYRLAVSMIRSDTRHTLSPTHMLRLGLAFNYSRFCDEILGARDLACQVAMQALDDVRHGPGPIDPNPPQSSVTIMQCLRDNVALWTSDTTAGVHEGSGGEVMPEMTYDYIQSLVVQRMREVSQSSLHISVLAARLGRTDPRLNIVFNGTFGGLRTFLEEKCRSVVALKFMRGAHDSGNGEAMLEVYAFYKQPSE